MNSHTNVSFTFDVAIVRRYSRYSRSVRKYLPPTTLVYAVVGKRMGSGRKKRSLSSVADIYRGRFGIESSYRQMKQARFRTSSRSPELRLLAVALALILRNLWVLCNWMSLARTGVGRRSGEGDFRFATLLRWICHMVQDRLRVKNFIQLNAPSSIFF